jgi:voltage-gated potassium channel
MKVRARPHVVHKLYQLFRRPGQFTFLLAALLCFLVIPAFFLDHRTTGVVATIFLSVVLLSALYVFPRRGEFKIACVVAVPALAGRWALGFHQDRFLMTFVLICWILFLAITVEVILRQVLTATRVTNDTIAGAICGYFMFALMYAFVFGIVEIFYPGSFTVAGRRVPGHFGQIFYQHEIGNLIYYSLVSLATMGYGDIVPVSSPARVLSALEGVAGQFYIAILIARLVSIRYAKWGE